MPSPGSLSYHFDDVHSHGATLKGQAAALEAEYHAIIADVNAAADIWGGAGSTGFQQFVAELNRNFQTIFMALDEHGAKVQTVGSNMQSLDQSIQGGWSI
ncbi:WXG100 family type VII secretion target [Mycobacterium sp. 29Ha]|jgi:WXG100 family type VII secretion target|uniref:WXG100 family type VII secretion target n=1 Tax=Mycobacterium sp. 29Ha TaxID=2939268 RepID=UPI002938DAE7|nr:WXG100 family type VII secretion target [Mycobacterium sp. 29Ha]MDV3133310.1 WXG100 family type VII secretion target [Mycobacterium sp. 29Ha]